MPVPGRRWRASLIIGLFFVAVGASAFIGWWYARESPPHQGPIVLISARNRAADRLADYSSAVTSRPAIDALAADGVVFDHAYAHSALTLPSQASILTGQLPFEHGVRDDAGFAIADASRTLAELMRNRGFATGAAVSSFLLRRASGIAQGFSFFDASLPVQPGRDVPPTQRDSSLTIDAAEQWMNQQSGQRYLLFVQVDEAGADAAVGRLVADLKVHGLYDDATIVFVGDHGGQGSAALTDAALHVPLIVKQPDSEGSGRRVAAAVQHIDLLPTILDLVRAPIPSGLRGRSLRTVLDSEKGAVPDVPIYAESLTAHFRLGGAPAYALTSGARRFIRSDGEALFDLEAGGRSLAVDTPDAARLRGLLDALVADDRIGSPAPIAAAERGPFAELGYFPDPFLTTPAPVSLTREVEATLGARHRAAALLVGQKNFGAAIDLLRAITRAHPELAVVHYQVGWLLLHAGRFAEAAAAFTEAARLQPDSAQIQVAMATMGLRSGDTGGATAHADMAVALAAAHQPDVRGAAHEVAARAALATHDAEAAMTHAQAAQAADATLTLLPFVRGRLLLDEGKNDEALQALSEGAKVATERSRPIEDLQASLGDAFMRLDRAADAETAYREELRGFPHNVRAYAGLVTVFRASNRNADVAALIGDLLKALPTPEGYATAVRLWTTVGERAHAEVLRAEARSRFRGDPSLSLLTPR